MGVLVMKVLLVLVLLAALVSVPLGIPGVWVMVAALLAGAVAGWVGWGVWAVLALLALVSEVLEFAVLKRMGERFGGTTAAFWGAVAGGFAGVLVGMPIPVVGPLLAGFVGTFAGAAAVTLYRTRSVAHASRVGWGMLLARTLAVGLKVGVGFAILVVGVASVVVG